MSRSLIAAALGAAAVFAPSARTTCTLGASRAERPHRAINDTRRE
jgi:hypothetical protein